MVTDMRDVLLICPTYLTPQTKLGLTGANVHQMDVTPMEGPSHWLETTPTPYLLNKRNGRQLPHIIFNCFHRKLEIITEVLQQDCKATEMERIFFISALLERLHKFKIKLSDNYSKHYTCP